MPTTMALWQLRDDGSAVPVPPQQLSAEAVIESAVESAPEFLGIGALIVGRQVATPSGPLDLLALDEDGHLVVVENKRDRTPREVVAQAIDYAAFVSTLTLDDVADIFADYSNADSDLAQAYEERFGEQLDALAGPPRMIVVASRLDDSTERMIDFLATQFDVPINAALFQPFEGDLIGRTWLRPEEQVRASRSPVRRAHVEASKVFWEHWLPIGREVLHDIRLPMNGPRSVLIKRRILAGHPSALTLWVSSSEAYAEVQFDDDEPAMNEALLAALQRHQTEIEAKFGGPLEWRPLEADGQMTKRTKVVTHRLDIGDRQEPSQAGMQELASIARRLVDAVKPYLPGALERANELVAESEVSDEEGSEVFIAEATETDFQAGERSATAAAPQA